MKLEWIERGVTLRFEAETESDLGFIEDLLRPQHGWATWAVNRSSVDWQARLSEPGDGAAGYRGRTAAGTTVVCGFTLDLAQLRNVDFPEWAPGQPTPAGVLPVVAGP
jgi:hypothetical protein